MIDDFLSGKYERKHQTEPRIQPICVLAPPLGAPAPTPYVEPNHHNHIQENSLSLYPGNSKECS